MLENFLNPDIQVSMLGSESESAVAMVFESEEYPPSLLGGCMSVSRRRS